MTPLKTYNLKLCFLTINGERLEGFSEDDAISFEESSDTFLPKMGADGQPSVSKTNDKAVTGTITVMSNSRAAQTLRRQQIAQLNETNVGPVLRRPFQLLDQLSGDRIADDFCVFLNEPPPSKAREIGTREFKVYLPNGKAGMLLAPNVIV